MLILAFDTTSEHGGVAIYRDTECLASVPNQGPANIYSVSLFQMVDRALGEARARHAIPRLGLRDIELFAAANGPGSFTGIRIGLAAAQGWAKAFDRPVKGVSALEAMVEEARPNSPGAVPILDARRGEFFLGLFRRRAGQASFQAEGEGWALKPDALRSFVEERVSGERAGGAITCLVREQDRAAQALRETLPDSLRWQSVPGLLVGAIAQRALQASKEGKLNFSAELDACYILRPDAELAFEKAQRGR